MPWLRVLQGLGLWSFGDNGLGRRGWCLREFRDEDEDGSLRLDTLLHEAVPMPSPFKVLTETLSEGMTVVECSQQDF